MRGTKDNATRECHLTLLKRRNCGVVGLLPTVFAFKDVKYISLVAFCDCPKASVGKIERKEKRIHSKSRDSSHNNLRNCFTLIWVSRNLCTIAVQPATKGAS